MGRKVRKQVTLTEEQAAALERRAQELGVSESELIRLGIQSACSSLTSNSATEATGGYEARNMTPEDATQLRELLQQIARESKERLAKRGGRLYPSSAPDIRRDREEQSKRWR